MADLTLFPGETLLKTISAGPGLVVDLIEGEAHGEARMALRHVEKVINPEAEVTSHPVMRTQLSPQSLRVRLN